MRSRRLLLAVAGAFVFAAGCENPASPDAATVNGTGISRDAFYGDVAAYAALSGDPGGFATDIDGVYDGAATSRLLGQRVLQLILEDSAERFEITIGDADLATYEGQLGAASALPESQRDDLLRLVALQEALLAYVGANEWWDDDDLQRYGALRGNVVCLSHILVSTEDEADDVVAALEDGAEFAAVAADRSIDTATPGGDLGCQPRGTFVAEFEEAVENAVTGDLVGPVSTEFGFHVIEVQNAYHPPTLDEARAIYEPSFQAGPDAWIEYVVQTADVRVDRRFGSWDAADFSVLPPEGAQSPTPEDPIVLQ